MVEATAAYRAAKWTRSTVTASSKAPMTVCRFLFKLSRLSQGSVDKNVEEGNTGGGDKKVNGGIQPGVHTHLNELTQAITWTAASSVPVRF